jgi:hypothetical protein
MSRASAHRLRGTLSTLGAEAAAELETELGRLDPELASLAEKK